MNNVSDYYRVAYKKYKAYCRLNRQELVEGGAEVDFQMFSFEQFMKEIAENPEFAKVWGYWNFI